MKRHIFPYLLPLLGVLSGLLASCTDELVEDRPATAVVVDDTNLVETRLSFDVAAMNTTSVQTRAADDPDDRPSESMTEEEKRGTDAERKIDNIWVFQFDATTQKLLITPRYYDLSDKDVIPDATDGKEVDVLLKPGVSSIVYVVANIGKAATTGSDWAMVHNSATLNAVKELTLPKPHFIAVDNGEEPTDLSLPMEGASEAVTPVKGQEVNVTVTRMYAKVEILIGDIPESLVLTDVNVAQIPYYCRVGTLATGDLTQQATYPIEHNDWNSRAFKPGTKDENGKYTGKLVVYLPENLQGRTDNGEADSSEKSNNAPTNAFRVDFVANYVDIFTGEEKERGRHYAVCPGANIYNDYNIRRNFIYRVRLNIYTDRYDQDIPSSNCFVVKPNQSLSFLPYYRTEKGGGYDFSDYLAPDGDDETKKINDSDDRLENIRIIWQTQDAIGDNSKGDRVWIDRRSEAKDELHRKIHVKTGPKSGNALIAAYNSNGDIIWSWHIWVTDNEPGNVSNAVVYSTYAWNERQIYNTIRVPGYAIMPCNLGALKYEPDDVETIDPDTHGMLYQWGRKDPFPPARSGDEQDYSNTHTDPHYANDNSTIVYKTAKEESGKLFHSLGGNSYGFSTKEDAISYTIQHPTVFLCGTKEAFTKEGWDGVVPGNEPAYYHNGGDWLPSGVHDNKLWGGLDPTDDGSMKRYTLRGTPQAHIYDNYGDEKSIFDPCPSGWRVPPGDLWLGFTSTGENPTSYDQINTDTPAVIDPDPNNPLKTAGMYLFMNAWQQGTKSFFPTQGTRIPNGMILRTGRCGNYHNATTDINDRVNILHAHRKWDLFHVFELTYPMYYQKSTGGPIRCVRDHK